jgi:hypothetical protein
MPLNRSFICPNAKALAWALILALLFAQWSGLSHRIVHADGPGKAGISAAAKLFSVSASGASDSTHHSCAAFDAATLALPLHNAVLAAPFLPNLHVHARWTAFASRTAPFLCHFQSRAPPAV